MKQAHAHPKGWILMMVRNAANFVADIEGIIDPFDVNDRHVEEVYKLLDNDGRFHVDKRFLEEHATRSDVKFTLELVAEERAMAETVLFATG